MTTPRVATLRTPQRRMLQKIIDTKRRIQVDQDGNKIIEGYVDWIQRATRKVEKVMSTMFLNGLRKVAGGNSGGQGMFVAALTDVGQHTF